MTPSNLLAVELAEELFCYFQSPKIIDNDTDEVLMQESVIPTDIVLKLIKKYAGIQPDFKTWAKEMTDSKLMGTTRLRYQVANKIQAAMKEKGITQADLADMLHKKRSQINKMLSGENMTINTIAMFQECLGINLLDLS